MLAVMQLPDVGAVRPGPDPRCRSRVWGDWPAQVRVQATLPSYLRGSVRSYRVWQWADCVADRIWPVPPRAGQGRGPADSGLSASAIFAAASAPRPMR